MSDGNEDLALGTLQQVQRIESLRPMSGGQVLDLSTKVYREVGAKILRPTFGAAFLVYTAATMMTQLFLPRLFLTRDPSDLFGQIGEVATAVIVALFTALPIVVIGASIILTHSVHAVSDLLSGREVHEIDRLQRADKDLRRTIGLLFRSGVTAVSGGLVGLVALLGSAALSEAGQQDLSALAGGIGVLAALFSVLFILVVCIRQSLAPAVLLLENLKPKEAAARSAFLLSGGRLAPSGADSIVTLIFILTLLILFFWGGVNFIYGAFNVMDWMTAAVGRFWWGEVAVSLVSGLPYLLGFWLLAPIWSVGTTVLYFERRIRLEGHDIELLHHELVRKSSP